MHPQGAVETLSQAPSDLPVPQHSTGRWAADGTMRGLNNVAGYGLVGKSCTSALQINPTPNTRELLLAVFDLSQACRLALTANLQRDSCA